LEELGLCRVHGGSCPAQRPAGSMVYAAILSALAMRLRITAHSTSSALCGAPHKAEFERDLIRAPHCLTGECSRDVKRCLTKRAPVASLILRPSRSSFSDL